MVTRVNKQVRAAKPLNIIKQRLDEERFSLIHSLRGLFIVSQDDFRAPAGWYPDPLGLPQLRWWNAQGWTEQVSAPPEPQRIAEQRIPEQRVQEQPRVQEPRYAWKEDEPPVIPVQQTTFRAPAPPQTPVATSLNALEAPRAQSKVDEPTSYADWQSSQATQAAAQQFAAQQPVVPAQQNIVIPAPAAQTPPPPPYWDEEDDSRPEPSVRPEDLKFWPGTSPAELRRLAREQAARDAQN